ncbi:MAG TPA: ATP synthase F1 subunit epsilon [Candidatus Binatia bacterium]|nr:ATP synthase F1 subunit epsilon [Candidatus Binatia bacterium]
MADTLELRVLTPQREVCDEAVSQVVAQGALGQFGVLPDHITFLTALEPGPLTFQRVAGGSETLAVKGGYAEVRDNVMTVLADDALPIEGIDERAARADLERAESALLDAPFGHPEHERLQREARWAAVRLELARS